MKTYAPIIYNTEREVAKLGKLSDDSIIDQKSVNLSNVFYDTFSEVKNYYTDKCTVETWEETCTISLSNTPSDIGLFDKSDIIIVYDLETHLPTIITERIFKRNYDWRGWRGINKVLKTKMKYIKAEHGFNIRVSFERDFIDYIHYKEEWWQWALKNLPHS